LKQPLLALFLLMLVQGVAAQRVFGGAERVVAWREAAVGNNMLLYFLGKDLASFIQIYFASAVFACVYWPLCPLQVSYHTMLWLSFAFNYAVWGMSYIWSIALEPSTAQMVAVIMSFVSFLMAGLEPFFSELVAVGDGFLIRYIALSPIRWAYGFLLMDHIVEKANEFRNPLIRYNFEGFLSASGMPLDYLFDNNHTCAANGISSHSTVSRWRGCNGDLNATNAGCEPGEVRPPNGLLCSVTQLYLLGGLFRFVALICLQDISKKHAKGGDTPQGVDAIKTRLFYAFLCVFLRFQLNNVLLTGLG